MLECQLEPSDADSTFFFACLAHSPSTQHYFRHPQRLCHQVNSIWRFRMSLWDVRISWHLCSVFCYSLISSWTKIFYVNLSFTCLFIKKKRVLLRTQNACQGSLCKKHWSESLLTWQHSLTCFPILALNGKERKKQDKAPQTLLCWRKEIPLCGEWVSCQDYK